MNFQISRSDILASAVVACATVILASPAVWPIRLLMLGTALAVGSRMSRTAADLLAFGLSFAALIGAIMLR